jgi:hypothetical protein
MTLYPFNSSDGIEYKMTALGRFQLSKDGKTTGLVSELFLVVLAIRYPFYTVATSVTTKKTILSQFA